MSCDYRRKKFLKEIINSQPQLVRTMRCEGQPEVAAKVLDRIYQLGCEWTARDEQAKLHHIQATTSLFLEFQAMGLPLPTHAKLKPGQILPLPKERAIDGYCKLHHILHNLRTFHSCPPIVEKLVLEERIKAAKTAYLKAARRKGAGVMHKIGVVMSRPEDLIEGAEASVVHQYQNARGDGGSIRMQPSQGTVTFTVLYQRILTPFPTLEEAEEYLRQKMAEPPLLD